MRAYLALSLVTVSLLASAASARAQQAATPSSLATLDTAFQDLYRNTTASMVRVSIVQNASAVLDSELKGQFDDWRKTNGGRQGRGSGGNPPGGGRGGQPGGGGRGDGGRNADGGGSGNPGGGFGGGRGGGGGGGSGVAMTSQVAGFLRARAEQLEKATPPDRQQAAKLRGLAVRVEISNRDGIQGEVSAIVIDKDGHALVPTGLLREAHLDPLAVTLPSGKETTARFVGASVYGGFSIIELADHAAVTPVNWSRHRVMSGQLLLSISAGAGLSMPLLASGHAGTGNLEDHLAVPADERGGIYLFDATGGLAVILAGGGWQGEHHAIWGEHLQRDVQYILQPGPDGKPGRDVEPRPLGVTFSPDKGPARRGVIITSVETASLASDAGLLKDDLLVSIDGKPVTELVTPDARPLAGLIQLQLDFATRTGNVPLVIIRDGKEQTLQMTLK